MNRYLIKLAKGPSPSASPTVGSKSGTEDSIQLKPYQVRALNKLDVNNGLLVDHSMGSGKTLLYLAAIKRYQAKNPDKKTLFIAPASLTTNFDRENDKHPLGIDRDDVDVLSYERAANAADKLRSNKYGQVIVDEAHRLRNTNTKRHKELTSIIENADQRLLGTGTSAYNTPSDIAPLINLAAGEDVLPQGKTAFDKEFISKHKELPPLLKRILGAPAKEVQTLKNKKELATILRKHMDYYNLKDDPSAAKNFPEKEEKVVEVPMSPSQKTLYEYMENKLPLYIRMKVRLNIPLDKSDTAKLQAFSTGIRQVSNSTNPWMPKYDQPTPKVLAAVDSVEKSMKSDKNFRGLVYSNYLDAGLNDYDKELTRRGISHEVFTGSNTKAEKDKMVDDYNSGKTKVLLVSSSGAEGLNLKGTKKVQILEPHFNDSKIDQVIGRGIRFKSHEDLPPDERKVEVEHYLSVFPKKKFHLGPRPNTIDEYLYHNSKTKSQVTDQMMDLVREKNPEFDKNGKLIKQSSLMEAIRAHIEKRAAVPTVNYTFPRAKYRDSASGGRRNDWTTIVNPVGSIKRDGAAFFMQVQPDGKLRYFSRRPSVNGGYPERTAQLDELTRPVLPQYAGNVYHVELVHTGHATPDEAPDSHPVVSGILNSLPARALETQKEIGPVRAVMLDVIHPSLPTYADKLAHMAGFVSDTGMRGVFNVPSTKIGQPAIEQLIGDTKASGHEGVVVTSLTEPESTNTRIKVKHVDTYNLRVVGIIQEVDIHGKPKQSMGALTVEDGSGKIVGNVGTGFSREDRIRMFKDPSLVLGKLIQVKAMPSTSRRLRAPVYNGFADGNIDTVQTPFGSD